MCRNKLLEQTDGSPRDKPSLVSRISSCTDSLNVKGTKSTNMLIRPHNICVLEMLTTAIRALWTR